MRPASHELMSWLKADALENMPPAEVTFDVSQPPGVEVKGWLNEAALANIEPMSVTFEVSHELRFWLNDVAPLKV